MRRRRDDDAPGLDERRRSLIHHYIPGADKPTDSDLDAQPAEQHEEIAHEPVKTSLRLLPSAPQRDVRIAVSLETLEQVVRLCGQVKWARVEGDHRRERLAAHAPRLITRPGSRAG